ncbi:MAG TPA: hypothetical protein VHW00_08400 [Thermoanaerobaculia bacterium]|nr:hypothetical protein [Thermoanaerobaculia bacterium]
MRALRLAVLLVFALSTAAAQTFPIAPPRVGPAPYQRNHPEVAASSEQFLVVWHDGREQWRNGEGRAFAARVSRAGGLLDPTGLPIGEAVPFHGASSVLSVASNGIDFLVATRRGADGVQLTKVTRDGVVQNAPALPVTAFYANLVSLGDGYALFYNENLSISPAPTVSTRGKVVIVDRDGRVVTASVDVVASSGQVWDLTAAMSADGTSMLMVWKDTADGRVHARTISPAALRAGSVSVTSEIEPTPANPQARGVSIVSGGDRYFVTWIQGTEYRGRVISSGGSAIGSVIIVATDQQPMEIEASWNGARFVAAYSGVAEQFKRYLRVSEFTPNGVRAFDATPNLQVSTQLAIDAIGGDSLIAWEGWGDSQLDRDKIRADIYDSSFTFKLGANPLLVSRAAATRSEPVAVWRGSHFFAAWREQSDVSRVAVARFAPTGPSLDGAGILLGGADAHSPSLATDGHDALVGWAQPDGGYVAHVSASGILTPRQISTNNSVSNVDVVFNGEDYAACAAGTLVRLGTDGTTKQISSVPQFNGGECHLAWSGQQYVLSWTTTDICFPICFPPTGLWAQAVSKDLTPLGGAVRLAYPDVTSEPRLAVAGDRTLIVWREGFEAPYTLKAKRITALGTILDSAALTVGEASKISDVYAEGENFVVVSGPYAWTVARNGDVGARQTRFPFVPLNADAGYVAAPVPFLIFQAPDAGFTPQLYGRFLASITRRGVRH